MGTSAATLQGINPENIQELSLLIADIYFAKNIDSTISIRGITGN